MRLGIDVSSMIEENAAKTKYFDNKKEVDPLKLFVENDVNLMRIRIWNNPYSEDGKPYLGGSNDLSQAIKIIRESKRYGYTYCINFHYSDFWVDPAKQMLPKAWKDYSFEQIVQAVYDYTKSSLLEIQKEHVVVDYVQVGNEITNGMLWPHARLLDENGNRIKENYPKFIAILNSGIKACREVYPNAKILIHLESSNKIALYEEVFGELTKAGVDYDVIGMSYYPYWHGSIEELFKNIANCREKFGKNVMITELGYAFTFQDYLLNNNGINQMKVNKENLEAELPYEVSPEGQALFIEDIVSRAKKADIEGIMYWEPLWRQGEGICWASEEGQQYINETGKSTRNEWANQCFFDYDGNKLPAFDKYKL